ncbi:MAG: tripartite tricarboxylate transporter permease [Clostridiaceae bacterium]|nr:tripartite tricarboxylate transporter permease [Clostridiaceae bacterium]
MELVLNGLRDVFTAVNLLLILGGTALGIVFGSVPGLTATMAVALCLPATYAMNSISAMCLLVGLYIGGISGGLVSAILLKIPGTPSSIATTFDGNPMAERGEAGKALSVGIWSSFLGGFLSFCVLFFVAPMLANVAVRFTPYDYFAVILFSLTMISSLSGNNLKKGIMAGMLGIFLSFVGGDPIDGKIRFTFGITALEGGFATLPVVIGLFAVTEVFDAAKNAFSLRYEEKVDYELGHSRLRWADVSDQGVNFIRSWAIGLGIGILPGIGGGVSNLISYTTSKKQSGHPEKYGTGCVDGIIASETANNATIGGALVPLLALGIPGDAITAVLIGAFMIHGISPGPLLFTTEKNLVYAIFAAIMVANGAMLVLMLAGKRIFTKILKVPRHILLPLVLAVCVIGAYGNNNRMFDVYVVLIFGVIGLTLKHFSYPVAPMVMGMILGTNLEQYYRRSLMFSDGSFVPFLTNPICAFFLTISVISVALTLIRQQKAVKNGKEKQ